MLFAHSSRLSLPLLLLSLCTLLLTTARTADAQIFQNFFGGGNAGGMFGGGFKEQEPPPAGDAKWFNDRVAAASCKQYLCPKTLSCVAKPSHCPCPFREQIRCSYKDTDSKAIEHSRRAKGTFDGVEAQLDLGGTICVTAESCDEVQAILKGAGTRILA